MQVKIVQQVINKDKLLNVNIFHYRPLDIPRDLNQGPLVLKLKKLSEIEGWADLTSEQSSKLGDL